MLVAVYGTLKRGYGNHRLLNDCHHVGDDYLANFCMYSLGAYPAVKNDKDSPHAISVEVYEVDDKALVDLDRLEGHPRFYQRQVTKTNYGDAFIYTMDGLRGDAPVVETGNWK